MNAKEAFSPGDDGVLRTREAPTQAVSAILEARETFSLDDDGALPTRAAPTQTVSAILETREALKTFEKPNNCFKYGRCLQILHHFVT